MRVAYLGPKGTYSQEAAAQHFGEGFESVFCSSLGGVVQSILAGHADRAVLPIENSTNGPVNPAVDSLLFSSEASNLEVCGEVQVAVRHQLYSQSSSLSSIKTVYSHPQVWGQVSHWLQKNLPHARRLDCDSTAAAVALALAPPSTLDPLTPPVDGCEPATTAALGGPLTSDAEPLVADCADNPTNTTRFLILKQGRPREQPERSGRKIAVVAAHNQTVANLVNLLASKQLQTQLLVPRPASKDWEYSYFIELSGSNVETAAAELGFRILGWHD